MLVDTDKRRVEGSNIWVDGQLHAEAFVAKRPGVYWLLQNGQEEIGRFFNDPLCYACFRMTNEAGVPKTVFSSGEKILFDASPSESGAEDGADYAWEIISIQSSEVVATGRGEQWATALPLGKYLVRLRAVNSFGFGDIKIGQVEIRVRQLLPAKAGELVAGRGEPLRSGY